MIDSLYLFLGVIFAGIIVALLLAPLESLEWWAGRYDARLQAPEEHSPAPYQAAGTRPTPSKQHYLIFLDGIAKVGAVNYDDVQDLLDRLSDALPDAVVLGDVMPYSVTNTGMTKGRPLSRFWRRAFKLKLEGSHDHVQTLGAIVFPGRWPITVNSYWNQAKRQGKISVIPMGPVGHHGPESYLDKNCFFDDGRSFLEGTLETIRRIVTEPEQKPASLVEAVKRGSSPI